MSLVLRIIQERNFIVSQFKLTLWSHNLLLGIEVYVVDIPFVHVFHNSGNRIHPRPHIKATAHCDKENLTRSLVGESCLPYSLRVKLHIAQADVIMHLEVVLTPLYKKTRIISHGIS